MSADIRPARVIDVDALSAIENAVFQTDRISPRSFRRLIASASAIVLVAGADNTVLGYLVLLFRSGSRRARLYSIAAAPSCDRSGVGRSLLAAAEAAAAERGADRIGLEVREDNLRAIGLYEGHGFHRVGRIASYYADGAAALRYRKQLDTCSPGAGRAAIRKHRHS